MAHDITNGLKITHRFPPDDSPSKNGPIDFRFRSKVLAWVVLHSIYMFHTAARVTQRSVFLTKRLKARTVARKCESFTTNP